MARQRNLYEILEEHELGLKQVKATLARVTSASFDHGSLGGLGDDDHTQYAKLSGAEFTGEVKVDSTVAGPPYAHIRLTNGATDDVLLRNDGSRMYFLISDTEDGAWNSLRPLSFSLSDGLLYADNGLEAGDRVWIKHDVNNEPGLEIEGGEAGNFWAGRVRFSTNEGNEHWDIGMRGASGSDNNDLMFEYYNGSSYSEVLRYDVSGSALTLKVAGNTRASFNQTYTQLMDPEGNIKLWLQGGAVDDAYLNGNRIFLRDASSNIMQEIRQTYTDFRANGGTTRYVRIAPDSADNQIEIVDDNPQMLFYENDISTTGNRYWFHLSGGTFYLLVDVDNDGTWESPHPWYVQNTHMFIGNRLYNTWARDNTVSASANVYINSSGYYQQISSSRRYKTDIEYGAALADIQLDPVRYRSKADDSVHYGFIAEDLAAASPLLEVVNKDGETEDYDTRGVLAILAAKVNRLEKLLAKC